MDRTTKAKKKPHPKTGKPEKSRCTSDTFTADMRFIVTRNKRNIWMDEMYETVPASSDLPVFNWTPARHTRKWELTKKAPFLNGTGLFYLFLFGASKQDRTASLRFMRGKYMLASLLMLWPLWQYPSQFQYLWAFFNLTNSCLLLSKSHFAIFWKSNFSLIS